jgi:hypothetical protein
MSSAPFGLPATRTMLKDVHLCADNSQRYVRFCRMTEGLVLLAIYNFLQIKSSKT